MLIRHGRQLASEIPNSNFKILSGNAHPAWYGDSKKIIEEILAFLGEGEETDQTIKDKRSSESEIVEQATIVFTDIKIKIGINTGEVIRRESMHPFGQAVVIASRIVEKCEGEQILISDVSKQLTAGGNFNFAEQGPFKPKGFNENIKLYEVSWK